MTPIHSPRGKSQSKLTTPQSPRGTWQLCANEPVLGPKPCWGVRGPDFGQDSWEPFDMFAKMAFPKTKKSEVQNLTSAKRNPKYPGMGLGCRTEIYISPASNCQAVAFAACKLSYNRFLSEFSHPTWALHGSKLAWGLVLQHSGPNQCRKMRGSRKNYCWALLQKNHTRLLTLQIWKVAASSTPSVGNLISNFQTRGVLGSFWMCIDVYGMYSWRAASKSQWKTRAMSFIWFPFFWVWSRCRTMVVADLQLQIIPLWNSGIYCITILSYDYLLPAFNTQISRSVKGKGNSYKSKNSR